MPKVKTKKVAVKRYKTTGTGKLMHRVQGSRHIRRKKDKSRQRRQDKLAEVTTKKFAISLNRMLGQ